MKIALVVTLLAITTSAQGQVATAPVPKDGPSIREQIKADRARAKADDENGRRLALGIVTAMESGRGTVRKRAH